METMKPHDSACSCAGILADIACDPQTMIAMIHVNGRLLLGEMYDQKAEAILDELCALLTQPDNAMYIRNAVIALYVEEFTADELREISTFVQTPAGRKHTQKTPGLMQKSGAIVESIISAHIAELQGAGEVKQ